MEPRLTSNLYFLFQQISTSMRALRYNASNNPIKLTCQALLKRWPARIMWNAYLRIIGVLILMKQWAACSSNRALRRSDSWQPPAMATRKKLPLIKLRPTVLPWPTTLTLAYDLDLQSSAVYGHGLLNWTNATSHSPDCQAAIWTDCNLSSTLPHVSQSVRYSTTTTSLRYSPTSTGCWCLSISSRSFVYWFTSAYTALHRDTSKILSIRARVRNLDNDYIQRRLEICSSRPRDGQQWATAPLPLWGPEPGTVCLKWYIAASHLTLLKHHSKPTFLSSAFIDIVLLHFNCHLFCYNFNYRLFLETAHFLV